MEDITAYLNRRIEKVLGVGVLEDVVVDYIFIAENAINKIKTDGLILEAKISYNPIPGIKHYTYRIDPQLGEGGPGRQRHIHMYYDGKEVFAMNADATAHDGYHHAKIAKELNPFLTQKGFPIPANNIIEFYQIHNAQGLLLEEMNCYLMNSIALNTAEAIRNAKIITIIEANVETYQVKFNSKIRDKYNHVNQLEDVPQDVLSKVKQMLIDVLQATGKYSGDTVEIFDSNDTPHKLFVAWS